MENSFENNSFKDTRKVSFLLPILAGNQIIQKRDENRFHFLKVLKQNVSGYSKIKHEISVRFY